MKIIQKYSCAVFYTAVLVACFFMGFDFSGVTFYNAAIGSIASAAFLVCIFLMATSGMEADQ